MKKQDEKEYLKAFGNHLKMTRKRLGFSQERLAYEAEIELRQLGRIERGEINTGILSIKIIAETLQIDPKELFGF
ncbi:MAG TPA: helix-turn-helix transcriptional regulator [Ferruginibacter sp.]|nr:XRE family transcriptional regulator [Chitinophagaceae bacterium]HRI23883.1 helix-turn-helix transcriptional regulator [Ferruginibacter sp.]